LFKTEDASAARSDMVNNRAAHAADPDHDDVPLHVTLTGIITTPRARYPRLSSGVQEKGRPKRAGQ